MIPTKLHIHSKHGKGRVFDIFILRKNSAWHRSMRRSTEDIMYHTGAMGTFSEYSTVIVDKGYQVLQHDIRTIHPTKKLK